MIIRIFVTKPVMSARVGLQQKQHTHPNRLKMWVFAFACLYLFLEPRSGYPEIIPVIPRDEGVVELYNRQLIFRQGADEQSVQAYNQPIDWLPSYLSSVRMASLLFFMAGVSLAQFASSSLSFGHGLIGSNSLQGMRKYWKNASFVAYGLSLLYSASLVANRTREFYHGMTKPISSTLYPVIFQSAPLLAFFVRSETEVNGATSSAFTLRIVSLHDYHSKSPNIAALKWNTASLNKEAFRLAKTLGEEDAMLELVLETHQVTDEGDPLQASAANLTEREVLLDTVTAPRKLGLVNGVLAVKLIHLREPGSQGQVTRYGNFDVSGQHQWIEEAIIGEQESLNADDDYVSLLSPEMLNQLFHWIKKTSRWRGLLAQYRINSSEDGIYPKLLPGPVFQQGEPRPIERQPVFDKASGCLSLDLGYSRYLLPTDLRLSPSTANCRAIKSWNESENLVKYNSHFPQWQSATQFYIDWWIRRIAAMALEATLHIAITESLGGYRRVYFEPKDELTPGSTPADTLSAESLVAENAGAGIEPPPVEVPAEMPAKMPVRVPVRVPVERVPFVDPSETVERKVQFFKDWEAETRSRVFKRN